MSITQLNHKHENEAVQILAHAFKSDPLYLHNFKTTDQVILFARYLYQKGLNQKEMIVGCTRANQLIGVACIGKTRSQLTSSLLKPSFLFITYKCFTKFPRQAFGFFIQYMRYINRQRPKVPHYNINWLAVDPASQGSGVGTKLLKFIHSCADNDNSVKEIVLNTENQQNVDYYKKFGYTLKNIKTIGGVHIYSMGRNTGN